MSAGLLLMKVFQDLTNGVHPFCPVVCRRCPHSSFPFFYFLLNLTNRRCPMRLLMSVLFLIIVLPDTAYSIQSSQTKLATEHRITATRTSTPISVDGVLNELAWESAPETSDFLNKWPADTGYAANQTKAWVLYDDDYLYIAAINYQKKEDLVIKSLKRDKTNYHWSSDGFSVVLDPFNQQTNGFLFGVNAAGARVDGMVLVENNNTRPDVNWDNVWHSAVQTHEDYWIAEFAIPFKTLNYDPGQDTWGINFVRNDMKRNEYSTWSHVPLAFPGIDIGHLGLLNLEEPPPAKSSNFVLQPYLLSSGNMEYEEEADLGYNFEFGADAKIPLGSSLKMDLTVNPDFSTVDVDQQVTNLSRFSIFFPEKRTFFLENSDLFTSFGTWGLKPFFSRQIGLDNGNLIPILFGARVTGNLGSGLRAGLMNVQTRSANNVSANNYTVAAFQQQLMGRTNVKALLTNRNSFDGFTPQGDEFNRTLGTEFNYTSPSGELTGNIRYHWSQTEARLNDASMAGVTLMMNDSDYYAGITADRVGDNFINELGFSSRSFHYDAERDSLVRVGYQFINPWAGLIFRPASDWINSYQLSAWTTFSRANSGQFIDRISQANFFLNTLDSGSFRFHLRNSRIHLLFPTNLIGGDEFLPVESYNFNRAIISYESDERGVINWGLNGSYGGFYNGTRLEYGGEISFRAQPWGNFGLTYIGNKVDLPGDYGSTVLHLLGPQAEINFSNTMNWTTFLQYNTQANNFNLNSRFQWRFASMSDLYLVYNDNYDTRGLIPQNRGLVF